MARLLVTGGAGFIGSNFVRFWLDLHPEDRVVVLDALTYAGNRESLPAESEHEALRFVHGDILDQPLVEDLLRDEHLDTIVHFAAESHVDRSISGPDVFLEVNILGTHSLLKAAGNVWLEGALPHRFHHVSTDEVFGSLGPEDDPFLETTQYAPNSPYAASKASADHIVRAYSRTYGLETTISNCSNNYGPYQYPEKLIPLAIINLLQGRPVPIYGDGLNVRDWLFVEDHCSGIDRILVAGTPGRTYNLGGDAERDNLALIGELCRLVDQAFAQNGALADRYPEAWPAQGESCETAITFVNDRLGHDRRYAIDASRAREELGFAPATGLSEGLGRTLEWYLESAGWWRGVTR
jgi:dTDP-glucose 4,6-dehydratase